MGVTGAFRLTALMVAVHLLVGCGPSEAERERAECDEAPECIEGITCNTACRDEHLEIAECCECLDELQCLGDGLTENRCNENLQRDGLIGVAGDCASNDVRCGTVCSFLQPST
ncbi:MAG: hypothetical protein IT382_19660 [Deltaproteobacteria bacterium]|nr:hypothetical protein [Deltaproteobacteria bacterium]